MGYYTDAIGFAARINEIESEMPDTIDANFSFRNGLTLNKMKETAEENLKGILKLLGYSGNDPYADLNTLNQKIQNYHKLTINFNGPNLRANVIKALSEKVSKRSVELEKLMSAEVARQEAMFPILFKKIVYQIIESRDLTDNFSTEDINLIAEELFSELNFTVIVTESGSNVSAKIPKKGKLLPNTVKAALMQELQKHITQDLNVNLKYIGGRDYDNFRNRVINLAKENHLDTDPDISKLLLQIQPEISVETTNDYLTSYYDLLSPFEKMMTPTLNSKKQLIIAEESARNFFDLEENKEYIPILYEQSLEYFKQLIPQDMQSNTFLMDKFSQALHDMVYEYPAAFFVGSNTSEIIGLLGELEGLYYLYSIMGDNHVDTSKITAEWIGSVTTVGDGAKTGADLVVRLGEEIGYGIQVKNSMELTGATSLSDFTLDDIKGNKGFQAQLNAFFGPEFNNLGQMLEDLYTMLSFNIGYKHEPAKGNKVRVMPGVPPFTTLSNAWKEGYEKLPVLINKANQLITIAAALFTRITYYQGQSFLESNTLYIIGGTAVISAAQILDDLIKQIDNIESNSKIFFTSARTYLGDKGYTIVDYINENGGNMVGLKTILSTSFNFHKVGAFNP